MDLTQHHLMTNFLLEVAEFAIGLLQMALDIVIDQAWKHETMKGDFQVEAMHLMT